MHYVPDYLSQVHVRLSSRTPEVDFCGKRTEKKKKKTEPGTGTLEVGSQTFRSA